MMRTAGGSGRRWLIHSASSSRKTIRPDCVCRPQSAELTDDTAVAVDAATGMEDAIVS